MLRLGGDLPLGRSSRTNDAGIERLRTLAGRHGLEDRGHRVVRLPLSVLHRGDAAPSCPSLRRPPPDGWSV